VGSDCDGEGRFQGLNCQLEDPTHGIGVVVPSDT